MNIQAEPIIETVEDENNEEEFSLAVISLINELKEQKEKYI